MAGMNERVQTVVGPLMKAALRLLSQTRLPQTRGALRLKGPSAPVEVLRDRWGVPHIYAKTAEDALYGQGFVHAQERLWQMDLTRRAVAGRVAEVLGELALPSDRAMRTLGMRRVAKQEASLLSGRQKSLVDAYCAGVNAWIDTAAARRRLPVEFFLLGYTPEPWLPADCTSWVKLMCWSLAANWQSELMRGMVTQRLGPEKTAALQLDLAQTWAAVLDAGRALAGEGLADATRAFTGPHAAEGVGSNNWVVHGTRTASGKPLLANDMHLGLTTPAIWYENHLVGGELNVTGVSLPGAPLVVAGHNGQVTWGYTDGMTDVQDLYEEHLRPAAGGGWEYEFRGEWLPAEVRQEEIKIKGGGRAVEEVVCTRHGPVINALFKDAYPAAPPLALRWVTLEPERQLYAIYEMNTARSCAEFHQALRDFDSPAQNVVFADTQGNIAYTLNGKIPIRARGSGLVPAPGWTGEYEWLGYAPFADNPHMENPPRGFVATANNPVSRTNQPVMISGDFIMTDRAARITELLAANPRVDVAYVQQMHFDQVSWSARALAAHLGRLQVSDPELQGIISQFRDWDGKLTAGSALALIHEATLRQCVRLMLEHHLGDLGVRVQGKGPFAGFMGDHAWEWFIALLDTPASPWFDLGGGEQRDQVLQAGLQLAMAELKQSEGPDPARWSWGDRHRLTFSHILGGQKPLDQIFSLGPYPIGGDGTTIWATFSHTFDLDSPSVTGPPFRFIADLGDLDHCLGLLAPGQSGHLASRHFQDGVKPWFNGTYHTMLFRRAEIEQNLEDRLLLQPE
jgi:penicillin amidase